MRPRKAEDCDQAVTGPLENVSFDIVDRLFPEACHTLEEVVVVLRVQLARQGRRADDVDHQDRNVAALPTLEQGAHRDALSPGAEAEGVIDDSSGFIGFSRICSVLSDGTTPTEVTPSREVTRTELEGTGETEG